MAPPRPGACASCATICRAATWHVCAGVRRRVRVREAGVPSYHEDAAQVDAHDFVKVLVRHLQEGRGAHDARVGDAHVEAAERRDGAAHPRVDVGSARHVAAARERVYALLLQRLGRRLSAADVKVRENDLRVGVRRDVSAAAALQRRCEHAP